MKDNFINKKNIIVPIISSLLIVIVGKLDINWYFKYLMFPYFMLLVSMTFLTFKNKDKSLKAYILLIPILLIIFSNLILKMFNGQIDEINGILNIFILPVLISIYLFILVNKNYTVSFANTFLMFKLFPSKLFSNLKYIKFNTDKIKKNKIGSIISGILIGSFFSVLIIMLLTSADDYFDKFMSKIMVNIDFNFDISFIIKFIIFFIIIFSVGINLIKCKDIKMREEKKVKVDKNIIISMLSVINFVFILFLISEISKLCGNFLHIPKGYIYSSYAREGFFELLFVNIINFSIIAFLLYKTDIIKENKIVKYLVIILIIFSILLIFNSYYRMFLYVRRFGLTNLRLQVILFLLMELIIFALIIKKIINFVKNDGIILLNVLTVFYVINLYTCNDLFVRIANRLINR